MVFSTISFPAKDLTMRFRFSILEKKMNKISIRKTIKNCPVPPSKKSVIFYLIPSSKSKGINFMAM